MRIDEIQKHNRTKYDPVASAGHVKSLLRGPFSQAWKAYVSRDSRASLWKGYQEGIYGPAPAGVVIADSNLGTRKSRNTENYYTLLVDNLPAFKGWPKRSKSFITTNSWTLASGYTMGEGMVYLVLPINNTKLAYVNQPDIWDAPIHLTPTEVVRLLRVNKYFARMGASDIDWNHFRQSLDVAEHSENGADFKFDYGYTPNQFFNLVKKNMTPKALGFTLEKIGARKTLASEVWFSGKALFMTKGTADKYLDANS